MATAIWQDVSSDWDDTNNWTGGGGTGGVPANSDTVVIASGTQSLDTNLTTGLTGITLRIGPGYTGVIGDASTFLDIDCTLVEFAAGAAVYLTGTTTEIIISDVQTGGLTLRGNASTDVTTIRVVGGSGSFTVKDGAALDNVYIYSSSTATANVESGVTGFVDATIESGSLATASALSGTLLVTGGGATVTGTATVGTVSVRDSGTVYYKSSGTITALETWDQASFNLTSSPADALTITASTMYGGTVDLRSAMTAVTLTGDLKFYGGTIRPPVNSSVGLA